MKYILSSLNPTNNINLAVIDAIKIAFSVESNEIRYRESISLDKSVYSSSLADRETVVADRVRSVCDKISQVFSVPIIITNIDLGNKVTVTLNINNRILTINP